MSKFRKLTAQLLTVTVVFGAVLAFPTPATASPTITISKSNPITGEPVTVTVSGLDDPGSYDLVYLSGVYDSDGKFYGEIDDEPRETSLGALESDGTWSGPWGLDSNDAPWTGDDEELVGIFPGILTVRPSFVPAPASFDHYEDFSVEVFPGKNRLGSTTLTFTGPGFANGTFLEGEDFTVAGSGFQPGITDAAAVVFSNPSPSNDIDRDFWRWYFFDYIDSGADFPAFLFYLSSDTSDVNRAVGQGQGLDLVGKSVWLYVFAQNDDYPLYFGYGVYSVNQIAQLGQGTTRGSNYQGPSSHYFITKGFERGKAKLNKPMRALIREELGSRFGETKVVCTGTVRGKAWTPKKEKLALARAEKGCNYITKLRPGVPVELEKRLIAKKKGKGWPLTVRIRVFY